MLDVTRPCYLYDVITDSDDVFAVTNDHHGGTGACPFDDGAQHPRFGVGVQVGGGLVEQQHRRR